MTLAQKWKEFAILFAVQFLGYCIVCISYIALAKGSYLITFCTDITCGLNSYFVIRRISASADNKNPLGLVGYTLGGACGSMLAIWISKTLLGF